MALRDWLPFRIPPALQRRVPSVPSPAPAATSMLDLPLYGAESSTMVVPLPTPAVAPAIVTRDRAAVLGAGHLVDNDEHLFTRLSGNKARHTRDLTPMQQSQMLRIVWFLWESNPLAKRLITLMTDLVIGKGMTIEADDERIAAEITEQWTPTRNPFLEKLHQLHNALCLDGELIIPAARNPITGRASFGYISPDQVLDVITVPDNVLIADAVILKPERIGDTPRTLKVIRENPLSGMLEGDVFYKSINTLPNSSRGRSDLLALADWLDLYDQLCFNLVERVGMLNSFVWTLKMTGATKEMIEERVKNFPTPKAGSIFAHNENEELEAAVPQLNAHENSEVSRMLRVHIAGSMGYPTSYLGDIDSNRATIEGQNDVLLRTPAARQEDFGRFVDLLVRYSLEGPTTYNPTLFKDANPYYRISLPEIGSKDIARVGQVVSSIVAANDTAMANRTMSRKAAITVQVVMMKHLGVDLKPEDVEAQADEDAKAAEEKADLLHAQMITQQTPKPGQRTNPPIPKGHEQGEPATV